MKIHETGDIFQIDPNKDSKMGAQFIVATDVKPWGIQGYLLLDHLDDSLVRVKSSGAAYYRVPWENLQWVGKAEWMIGSAKSQEQGGEPL